jgi:hypothetical protein
MSKSKNDFDEWLTFMDDRLEQLFSESPSHITSLLDYSPKSLTVLENWLMSLYKSPDEIPDTDKYFIDKVSCYVGETFRKNIGAKWTIDLTNQEDVYYGLPVIEREGKAPDCCPLALVTACLDRRRGTYMETILNNTLEESEDD